MYPFQRAYRVTKQPSYRFLLECEEFACIAAKVRYKGFNVTVGQFWKRPTETEFRIIRNNKGNHWVGFWFRFRFWSRFRPIVIRLAVRLGLLIPFYRVRPFPKPILSLIPVRTKVAPSPLPYALLPGD